MTRRATDKDIRGFFKLLVRDAVSCDEDRFEVPTWIGVEVAALIEKAPKPHGGQRVGGRAKVREHTALSLGKVWWRELKAQKVPQAQRKAAERVKRFLPHHSVETIMRRMRSRAKSGK